MHFPEKIMAVKIAEVAEIHYFGHQNICGGTLFK